jgi:ribosomal protein S18 acetylase RimI-like enzyme
MIDIRVLTPDDWMLWRELRLAALAEAPHAFGSKLAEWQGDHDREQRWRDRLSLAGAYNIVAVLDGVPVGMVSAVPVGGAAEAELISMWVAPAVRGRGVGDRLIEAVVAWAGRGGASRLRLSVMPDNGAAQSLYRRNGFVESGEPGDLGPDGRRELVFVRRL